MKETRNKKLVYLLIAIIGITSLLIGSYAFVDVRLSGNKKQVIKAGNLNLTLDEKDGITLENALPAFDEVGMLGEPYTFTLKNESAFPMKYALKLIDISKGDNYLAYEDIRYGLTKNGQNAFGSISELDNLLIDEGSISNKEEISYELRLWIDNKVMDNTKINGKSRTFKVGIEASKSDDDIILAATLNGEAVSTFPTREDNYGVESITCSDNLSASFNPLTWSVTVDGVTNSNTKCVVNFSSNITLDETDEALTMSKSELYAFYKGTFSGTASSSEVLSGKTVYINGVETTGTMPNNGSINKTILPGEEYSIPKGYHDGTGKVIANKYGATYTANTVLHNSARDSACSSYTWTSDSSGLYLLGAIGIGATANSSSIKVTSGIEYFSISQRLGDLGSNHGTHHVTYWYGYLEEGATVNFVASGSYNAYAGYFATKLS